MAKVIEGRQPAKVTDKKAILAVRLIESAVSSERADGVGKSLVTTASGETWYVDIDLEGLLKLIEEC